MPTTPIETRDNLTPVDSDAEEEFDHFVDRYYTRRNILIYDREGLLIGGLDQRGDFSVSSVYRWMEILFLFPKSGTWSIQSRNNGAIVSRALHTQFPTGSFYIVDQDSQKLSPSKKSRNYIFRCLIHKHRRPTHMDDDIFRRVRRRDRRCLITGQECDINLEESGAFESSMCVRIFPLMHPSNWSNHDIQHIFAGLADSPETFAQSMQSPANSFICQYLAATAFTQHWCAIDVDDDYRIVSFIKCENFNIPLDAHLRVDHLTDEDHRPSDALLRWHFNQALIRWMANDPTGQRDFITATDLASETHRSESAPDDPRFMREPGKSVFESYMAQQLLGCSFELGNEFQDRFRPPDNSDFVSRVNLAEAPQLDFDPSTAWIQEAPIPVTPSDTAEPARKKAQPLIFDEDSFFENWDKESAFNVDLVWTLPADPEDNAA
ncbi:hypothetical protein SISNIDRAFT_547381 [Sistotremastrum niveocremeum HHB9708]|uniref:HNH nuclease domain-containing protein n=1 Tax=Sistotremastrum niveocremeum HHB9708 TaxID=1314777 RepID=A0A164Z1X2_9AGAM|nr:hypothetical protein SISNIDRAFT_547381 [Sistotremastrum niveocremeum HHB9708]